MFNAMYSLWLDERCKILCIPVTLYLYFLYLGPAFLPPFML